MLASTIIPALIKKKGKGNNSNFFGMRIKYPELFKRENYPLSKILMNNLLKDYKNFIGCYSKYQIQLIN